MATHLCNENPCSICQIPDRYDSGYVRFGSVDIPVALDETLPPGEYRLVNASQVQFAPVGTRLTDDGWVRLTDDGWVRLGYVGEDALFPQRWIAGIDQPIEWKEPKRRPTQDEVMLDTAKLIATRSTCNRRQVGAVFALDGRILVTGYNGSPSGFRHCGAECHEGGPNCTNAVHAEANAIAWAARNGVRLQGANAYLTLSPCVPCAQLLLNVGVNEVHYAEQYRDIGGLELLWSADIYTKLVSE